MLNKAVYRLKTSQAFLQNTSRSFAVNEKQIKMRSKSVKSIEKITKAMKMVATSKMKADMGRLLNGKNFGVHAVDMMFTSDKYMKDRAPSASQDPE